MSIPHRRIIRFVAFALPIVAVLVGMAMPASSAQPGGLEPSSWQLLFDDVTVGSTSGPQSVTLTNFQHGPVNFGQASLLGPHPRDFVVSFDTCSGQRLEAGQKCAYHVRFRPTVKGTRFAELKIPNDSDRCTLWIDLAGSGPNQEPAARAARCGDEDATPPPSSSQQSSSPANTSGSSQTSSSTVAQSSISLPSQKAARSCTSRRVFRIRIHQPRHTRFTKVTVRLNRKLISVRRGKRLTASVNLKGLPRGRFTLRVIATTSRGRILSRTRHYVTCVANKG